MLFNPPAETLEEGSLLGSLMEGSTYQLDSKPMVNVGTIGSVSYGLNPIAEAVNIAISEGKFRIIETNIEADLLTLGEKASLEYNSLVSDIKAFNEGVAVFAKSKELTDIEETLDIYCKETQGFMLDAVSMNKDFAKISEKLEKYFGFGNLVVNCKGMEGFAAMYAFYKLMVERGYHRSNIRKRADTLANNPNTDSAELEAARKKAEAELDSAAFERTKQILVMTTGGMALPGGFTTKTDFISSMQQQFSDIGSKIDGNDGRFKWKTNEIKPYTYIEIQLGLMASRDMTGGNILAIILHEIGHSFYQGSILSRAITSILSILRTWMIMVKYVDYYATKLAINAISKSTILSKIYNVVYSAIFNIFNLLHSVNLLRVSGKIANLLGPTAGQALDVVALTASAMFNFARVFSPNEAAKLVAAVTNPMTLLNFIGMDGLSEEKFCDNFAAAHGYGPELADALTKMVGIAPWSSEQNKDSALSNIRSAVAFVNSVVGGILHATDTHPAAESRPLFIIDFYKEELKKAKDPKTRKYIEGLIAQTLKYSAVYQVSPKPIKSDLMRHALTGDSAMFHTRTTSLFDIIKNAVSLDTGSLNKLANVTMK